MGQHCVDRQCIEWIVGIGKLFDQTDAIYNDVRTDPIHRANAIVVIEDVDPRHQTILQVRRQQRSRCNASDRAERLVVVTIVENAQNRIAEHAGRAEDENFHR